jgi:hypothetical protein
VIIDRVSDVVVVVILAVVSELTLVGFLPQSRPHRGTLETKEILECFSKVLVESDVDDRVQH